VAAAQGAGFSAGFQAISQAHWYRVRLEHARAGALDPSGSFFDQRLGDPKSRPAQRAANLASEQVPGTLGGSVTAQSWSGGFQSGNVLGAQAVEALVGFAPFMTLSKAGAWRGRAGPISGGAPRVPQRPCNMATLFSVIRFVVFVLVTRCCAALSQTAWGGRYKPASFRSGRDHRRHGANDARHPQRDAQNQLAPWRGRALRRSSPLPNSYGHHPARTRLSNTLEGVFGRADDAPPCSQPQVCSPGLADGRHVANKRRERGHSLGLHSTSVF